MASTNQFSTYLPTEQAKEVRVRQERGEFKVKDVLRDALLDVLDNLWTPRAERESLTNEVAEILGELTEVGALLREAGYPQEDVLDALRRALTDLQQLKDNLLGQAERVSIEPRVETPDGTVLVPGQVLVERRPDYPPKTLVMADADLPPVLLDDEPIIDVQLPTAGEVQKITWFPNMTSLMGYADTMPAGERIESVSYDPINQQYLVLITAYSIVSL